MNLDEKFISSEYVYKGKFSNVKIDTIKLPNGKIETRELIEHTNAVCVVALTKEQDVLMVKQYRCAFKKVLLEVPAGKIDKGEEPDAAVKRELKEETGATGKNYRSMGKMCMTPGFCDEEIYMYICDIEKMSEPEPDEDEFLEVLKIPMKEAVSMVERGEIEDAKTCAALMKANLILGK